MRPLTIITGIVMGSSVAISLGLLVVTVLFLFTGLDEPRIKDEFPALAGSVGWFILLTIVSATSFAALLRDHRWRWQAQVAMWLTLALVASRYWPAS